MILVLKLIYLLFLLQLLSSALDALVNGGKYCSVESNLTLLHRIAALHIAYEKNKSQVLWFGQLVALSPEVMIYLHKDSVSDGDEMVLNNVTHLS